MKIIAGVDEVGRGCLAGPLVAAVVVLNKKMTLLQDSKKLTSKVRENLANKIKSKSLDYGTGWVWPEEIDAFGLSEANRIAMTRALGEITCEYDELIIDGSINYLSNVKNSRAMIKADAKIKAVSAASILAKVERDNYMVSIAKEFPDYGFDKHVGYGTKFHLDAIQKHGATNHHRKSFAPVRDAKTVRLAL